MSYEAKQDHWKEKQLVWNILTMQENHQFWKLWGSELRNETRLVKGNTKCKKNSIHTEKNKKQYCQLWVSERWIETSVPNGQTVSFKGSIMQKRKTEEILHASLGEVRCGI